MDWITDSQIWISLITLTVLEIILGIDNIVVISILTNKLPQNQQPKARSIGISLALVTRILLLLSIVWLASLTIPLFSLFNISFSVRDLILIAGGLFLLFKGTHEIHAVFEREDTKTAAKLKTTFVSIIFQIILFDIIFSLDSVITAIGMAQKLGVMIAAVTIAILIMLVASHTISNFIHHHPSLKMLALSFLLMVGVTLIAEGLEFHIPKGYIYFAMGFSGFVETLNIIAGNRRQRKKGILKLQQES
jgi:predicted tellurium resistance membrane protein TerC